jgi:hypothetical protein
VNLAKRFTFTASCYFFLPFTLLKMMRCGDIWDRNLQTLSSHDIRNPSTSRSSALHLYLRVARSQRHQYCSLYPICHTIRSQLHPSDFTTALPIVRKFEVRFKMTYLPLLHDSNFFQVIATATLSTNTSNTSTRRLTSLPLR